MSGETLVDGRPTTASFQRETGYAQQQDLHLETSTVREALQFSAVLRQPTSITRDEKYAYVEEVIEILHMKEYADAIVGVIGEGLNVEQRKRLTIGVELAARPQLLLFLDEPTSGLDNQTSWSILDLLERLARNGQAILCTIHQPSAILFQRFDRLLFLSQGKSLYFGEIGENSATLTNYFTKNGAPPCPPDANPAEWIMEITASAPSSSSVAAKDWAHTWRESPERQAILSEIASIKKAGSSKHIPQSSPPLLPPPQSPSQTPFATPFPTQLLLTTHRTFLHYYRSPNYILSRIALSTFTALFVGFSFYEPPSSNPRITIAGAQSRLFATFMTYTIFGQLAQQSMPLFVSQRALYEARERKSRTVRWQAFLLANVCVEAVWTVGAAVLMWAGWWWPTGGWRNGETNGVDSERSALMFLYILAFLLFCSTFSSMIIAGANTAENGGNIANLMFNLCLIFCGYVPPPPKTRISKLPPPPTLTPPQTQRPRQPYDHPPPLLDIHVPPLPPNIPHLRPILNLPRPHPNPLLAHRTPTILFPREHFLLQLSPRIHHHVWGLRNWNRCYCCCCCYCYCYCYCRRAAYRWWVGILQVLPHVLDRRVFA